MKEGRNEIERRKDGRTEVMKKKERRKEVMKKKEERKIGNEKEKVFRDVAIVEYFFASASASPAVFLDVGLSLVRRAGLDL